MHSPLCAFFGRIEIIHLRSRTDRFAALASELRRLGIDIEGEKVNIPDAPMPSDPNGFPSRGVYGNFLSHLDILSRALQEDLESVLVLEDDAIFRSSLAKPEFQSALVEQLQSDEWSLCFPGHPLADELRGYPRGLVACDIPFKWAHCYAVHRRGLPQLVDYMQKVIERSAGHPEGGKMYIDGALSMFRRLHPEVKTLVANPALSIQGGSPSSLALRSWYDKRAGWSQAAMWARALRDEAWRRTGYFSTK